MLWGGVLNLVFVAFVLLRYPSLLSAQSLSTVLFCIILLVVYVCIGVTLPLRAGESVTTALWQGTGFGFLIGFLFVIDIAVEYFLDMGSQMSTLSTLGFMGLLFLLFGVVGARISQRTGRLLLGSLASVWSALLGVLIAVLFGVIVNMLFLQRLEHLLASDFLRSGMNDPTTFTFFNTLDSASSHLLEAPILAAIFGTLGALLGKSIHQFQKNHEERRIPLPSHSPENTL